MLGLPVVARATALEPPDVIAQLDAFREAGFGQVVQVTIDRGPIEPQRHELCCEVGMRQRRLRPLETGENLESRDRRP